MRTTENSFLLDIITHVLALPALVDLNHIGFIHRVTHLKNPVKKIIEISLEVWHD